MLTNFGDVIFEVLSIQDCNKSQDESVVRDNGINDNPIAMHGKLQLQQKDLRI